MVISCSREAVSLVYRATFSMELFASFESYWFAPNSKVALAKLIYSLDELPVQGACRQLHGIKLKLTCFIYGYLS